MAIMYPERAPSSFTGAERAEQKVYERLQADLPDDVHVLHSLPYVESRKEGGRDGEIDFVIADPTRGLLVLEVKGGKEIGARSTGEWYSVSHSGAVHTIKDPYRQARRNLYAITREIRQAGLFGGADLPFPFGYAAVFPGVLFSGDRTPMHVRPALTVDTKGLQEIEDQIASIFRYWTGRRGGEGTRPDDLQAVVDEVLRPTFTSDRPLRAQVEVESALFTELTEQQAEVYEDLLRANRRALVRGGAGTGKTVLAERRATELAETGHNTLFLCFNRLLADHMKEKTKGLENLRVATFHELADVLASKSPWGTFPDDPDPSFWEEGSAELLFDIVDAENIRYDAIIVDEAQDFRSNWWLPVEAMAPEDGYLYIFCDPEQNVYGTDLSELETLPTTVPLKTNCRTTRHIRSFFDDLADLDDLRDAPNLSEGEEVETFSFSDRNEQIPTLERLVRRLKSKEGFSSSDIVLLSPYRLERSVLEDRLAGYYVKPYQLTEPPEDTLYHSTILGFKGMDAKAVILFDIAKDHVASRDPHVYVGCSRAKHLLFVLHEEGWAPGSG